MNLPVRRARFILVGAVAGAASSVAIWGLHAVFAEGIPTSNPLYYSGTLTENGQLVNAPRQLAINVWSNPAAQTGEVALCSTNVASTPVISGRFRVALDASCTAAIHAHPDTYVEVVVGGSTSLGRAKVGAVPYAVEAEHAVNATHAIHADSAGSAASFTVANDMTVGGPATFNGKVDINGRAVFGQQSGLATSAPIAYGSGPLPRSGMFASSGGALLLFVSASAFNSTGGALRIEVMLDGSMVGALQGFTNEPASHKSLTSNPLILTGVAAGMHRVALTVAAGTTTDLNDYSAVTVLELPL
jgi:hypothetical protein